MTKPSSGPYFNPKHWGYRGTVKHVVGGKGTVKLNMKDGKEKIDLHHFVNDHVPQLRDNARFDLDYKLFTGYLQTLYLGAADFSKKNPVFYGREMVTFSDTGVATADWVMEGWETRYKFNPKTCEFDNKSFKKDLDANHPEGWPRLHPRTRFLSQEEVNDVHKDSRPIVVIMHGLAGGSHEPIIKSLTYNLSLCKKFQIVVLNTRGCARSKITTRNLFTAFHTQDMREFLQMIVTRHQGRKIYAIGCSFGATMLANYLGEDGDKTPVTAACTVCNPWDMVLSGDKMNSDWWTKKLFAPTITSFLTRMVKVNMRELEVPNGTKPDHQPTVENPSFFTFTQENLQKAYKFKAIHEFDDLYTAPSLGFKNAMEYYRAASSINRAGNIKVPLLSLNSKDDPVVGPDAVPFELLEQNPNILQCETDLGGHLAFLDSNKDSCLTRGVAEFFNTFDECVA